MKPLERDLFCTRQEKHAWIRRTLGALATTLLLTGPPPLFAAEGAAAPPLNASGTAMPGGGPMSPEAALGVHEVDPRLVRRVIERQRQGTVRDGGAPQTVTAGRNGENDAPTGTLMDSTGELRIFALLIDFPDEPHVTDSSAAHAKLFGTGSPPGSGYPIESLANWYSRSSHGLLSFHQGVTLGWWTAGYSRSSIVGSTEAERAAAREKLIREAIAYFDAAEGVDFSQFDNDRDGAIDYLMVIWSGSPGGDLWIPYYVRWKDLDPSFRPDGMRIAGYSWFSEENFLVAIHETGHALGLPDLYDKPFPDWGPPGGVGNFDMMHGNRGDFNCFTKWLLGWVEPTLVSAGTQTISLDPSATHRAGSCVFVMPGLTPDGIFGEFFLVQHRSKAGNDDIATFPAEGLWIWHVDATLGSDGGFRFNNQWTHHKLLRPMEADGLEEIEQDIVMNAGDIYATGDRFGDGTKPSSRRYGGEPSGLLVTDIAKIGTQFSARFSLFGRTAAGHSHTLLVKSDGSLWAWGRNAYGQLGDGSVTDTSSPTRIGAGFDWRFASGGSGHTVAVKTNGTLWGWGWNQYGQVGDGTSSMRSSPVPVDSAKWSSVATGGIHSAALQVDEITAYQGLTRWAWGFNQDGELGDGDNLNVNAPKQADVDCVTDVPCGYDWLALAVGTYHNMAIRADGTLWAWGKGDNGQLGTNSWGNRYTPYQVSTPSDWVAVAAGGAHTLAIRRDGSLWAWGLNNRGQLGDGTLSSHAIPVRVGSDVDWTMVAAGENHSLALKRDGSLWAWGLNNYGQHGDDSSAFQRTIPTRIGSSYEWNFVAAGLDHSLGIRTDGTLWAAGRNAYGQLGDGTTTDNKAFRQVMSTLPTFVSLSALPPSPRQAGALVTFTAAASGGTGSHLHQFWLDIGGDWSVVQDYSDDDTWDWETTGLPAGTYRVRVHTRNAGSVAPLEASDVQEFELLPVPQVFTLSVSTLGTGSGTITSIPPGIDCGSDCSEDYVKGTNVMLYASPAVGSTFTGWGGACFGTGSCSVPMTSPQSVTASFALVPTLELTGLTLSTATVAGCKSVTGTVTISQPAPSAGAVITLGDTLAAASTPATVKIYSGRTKNTFKVTTLPVATEEGGTVSATLGAKSFSQPLGVRPIGMYSVTLSPTSVVGGLPVTGTAKLECAAGPGPVTVELASTSPGAASPEVASIVVARGVQSAPFDVTTHAVPVKTSASISATANGRSKSKTLTVSPAASASPTSLKFGYVTLNTTSPVLNVIVYNKGTQPYSITGIGLTGTSAKYFAQTNDCPGTLDAGNSCTIGVTFTPTVTGSKTAKVTIANSATATPLSVSLSGTGVLP